MIWAGFEAVLTAGPYSRVRGGASPRPRVDEDPGRLGVQAKEAGEGSEGKGPRARARVKPVVGRHQP